MFPEESRSGPIYVCTRNNDLDTVINKTPIDRRTDLVFLQNGILTEFLEGKGLEENTQGLVYFAVAKLGDEPIDGKTDVNPEVMTRILGAYFTLDNCTKNMKGSDGRNRKMGHRFFYSIASWWVIMQSSR